MADASDFDKYFNFDHNGYIAPKTDLPWITSAPSPVATDYKKALDELNQDYLTKKSHQYQQHRQQASLPLGSLSDLHSFNYNDSFFPLAYLGNNVLPSPVTDHPDFGVDMSHGTAQSLDADEIDFNTPLDYLTGDVTFSDPRPAIYVDNCINPAEIGGQEDLSPLPQPRPTSPDRLWPGIHQQYAEGTEAEALSQQSTQRPSPSPKSKTRKSDPVVDERISRLLCQMRQNNVATNDNNTTSPDVGGSSSQLARTKKDVEDMDEDERLLASEEGKNLTPGQRRQLRNKVSARAFRSRRKGELRLSWNDVHLLTRRQNT